MYCIHIIIHNSYYIYLNFHVFDVLLTFLRSKLGGGSGREMKGCRREKKRKGTCSIQRIFSRRIAIWIVPSPSLRVIFRFDHTFCRHCFFFTVQQDHQEQVNLLFVWFWFFFFFLLTTLGKSVSCITNLSMFHSFAGHWRAAYSTESPV